MGNVADFLRGLAKTGNQIPKIRSTFLSLRDVLNYSELWLMDEPIMSRPLLITNACHINSIFYQETRTLQEGLCQPCIVAAHGTMKHLSNKKNTPLTAQSHHLMAVKTLPGADGAPSLLLFTWTSLNRPNISKKQETWCPQRPAALHTKRPLVLMFY